MIRLALILAVVAGGGRCTDSSGSADPGCGDDGCPDEQRCVEATCVGDDGPAYPFTLRVLPLNDSGLAPVEVRDIRLEQSVTLSEIPIRLPAVVPVNGQVLGPDDRSQPVRRIVVEPLDGITERPLRVEGDFSPINPTLFSFGLTPAWPTLTGGRIPLGYRVRAALRDLPPWQATLDWSPGDRQVVVRVPSTDEMPTISGEVRALGLPIRGLRVVALDEATGRPVSSDADTDSVGRFSVRLWPTGAAQSVLLHFASPDPARPLPSFTQPVTAPMAGSAAPLLVDLPVPGQSERVAVRVLQPQGDARVPVAGVDVTFTRQFETGAHVVRGRTDRDGVVSVLAFPGDYQVDLIPPADGPSRISRVILPLGAVTADALLRPRTAIGGTLVDAAGRPVADALLRSTLLSAAWADESLITADERPPSRRFEARTAADGQFLLNLDPGRHRLQITPPPERGLAPFVTTFEFQGDQPRTDLRIALPAAVVLSGVITDEDDAPVAGAAVDIWVQSTPPQRLGRVRTDADGRYRVRIPSRLQ